MFVVGPSRLCGVHGLVIGVISRVGFISSAQFTDIDLINSIIMHEPKLSIAVANTAAVGCVGRVRDFFRNVCATNRGRIGCIAALAVFLLIVRALIVKFAPAGYTQLECLLTDAEIGRSERLLRTFSEVARDHNFTWWLDYGSLLGIVRGGTLIPHDKDIDGSYLNPDTFRLKTLDAPLRKRGLRIYGFTVVYAEDHAAMDVDGGAEFIVARLELFGVDRTTDNKIVRRDAERYRHATAIGDRIWWFLLSMTGVTVQEYDDIFPLSSLPLRHLDIAKRRGDPVTAAAPPTAAESAAGSHNHDDGAVAVAGNGGGGAAAASEWRVMLPVPRAYERHLERLYGSSWRREIPWKLKCYM